MATDQKLYLPTHPGRPGIGADTYHYPPEGGPSAYQAAFISGQLFKKNTFPIIGGGFPYVAADWTITTGGTGDSVAVATTAGGGILITAASDDNFDTPMDSIWGFTPASGKVFAARYRFQVSAATGIGFKLGMTTGGVAAALPFGTNYTDVVALSKAIASAPVTGTARGNSGTAAATGTLGSAANDTEIDAGFWVCPHATEPFGSFYYNGTVTPMTADQLAQVVLLLTTPATLYHTIHVTGVTGTNPTLLVKSALAMVDM
jgi:hypothetical protein